MSFNYTSLTKLIALISVMLASYFVVSIHKHPSIHASENVENVDEVYNGLVGLPINVPREISNVRNNDNPAAHVSREELLLMKSRNMQSSLEDCSNQNRCVGVNKAEFVLGEEITVNWKKGGRNNRWRVIIIPDNGQGVNSNNVKLQSLAPGLNGSKKFTQTSDLTPGDYKVFLTTGRYAVRAGPILITVVTENLTRSPTKYPTESPTLSQNQPTTLPPSKCEERDIISEVVNYVHYKSMSVPNSDEVKSDFIQSELVHSSQAEMFTAYGCFYFDYSDASKLLKSNGQRLQQRAEECSKSCMTKHFAVTETVCHCYIRAPTLRLSIDSCDAHSFDPCLKKENLMNAFMKDVIDSECDLENTRTIRNFFVQEHDAPFGYDIITNTYHSSPFELKMDKCGTNIYLIQTEVSEGTTALTTVSNTVSEFANERRVHVSNSLSASGSASAYIPFIIRAGASVSASMDVQLNEMMSYSGAETEGSEVFTSFGVKTLAEIKIQDFDNMYNFVTFSETFANALIKYRDNGYKQSDAKEIFDKYGMFVVERGIFGGYRHLKSVLQRTMFENAFKTKTDWMTCYEIAVSGNAKALFGMVSLQASAEIDGCIQEVQEEMQRFQAEYSQYETNEIVKGGKVIDLEFGGLRSFVVTPEDSTLLIDPMHYPPNDNGLELRILTDFLSPEKISPLEVKRYFITERDFLTMKLNLEAHMFNILNEFDQALLKCDSSCTYTYLDPPTTSNQSTECKCYKPTPEVLDLVCKNGEFLPRAWNDYYISTGGLYWKATGNAELPVTLTDSKTDRGTKWRFEKVGQDGSLLIHNTEYGVIRRDATYLHLITSRSGGVQFKATCQNQQLRSKNVILSMKEDSRMLAHCKHPSCTSSKYCDNYSCEKNSQLWTTQFTVTTKRSLCRPPKFLPDCEDWAGRGYYESHTRRCGCCGRKRKYCDILNNPSGTQFNFPEKEWTIEIA